jgi:hypothetical protein
MSIDTPSKKSGDNELKFQDYSKRILELYDDRSRNFWRSFWVVIESESRDEEEISVTSK